MFDHVDHPGDAKAVDDFAEAVGPERFLPGHLNAPADGQRVEPALAFSDIAGIEDEGEAGVMPDGQPSDASCAGGGISPKVILNISSAPSVC